MTYDNIKSHKKPGFHPLFTRWMNFWKSHKDGGGGGGGGEGQGVKLIPPEGFLGLSVVNPRKGSVKELIQPMAAKTRSPVILTYFESITDA